MDLIYIALLIVFFVLARGDPFCYGPKATIKWFRPPGYERLIAVFPKALQNLYLAMTAAITVRRCLPPMIPCFPCFSIFSVRISVRFLAPFSFERHVLTAFLSGI